MKNLIFSLLVVATVSIVSCDGGYGDEYFTYEVAGNEIVDISYMDTYGVVQNLPGEQLPWSMDMLLRHNDTFLYLKVENSNGDNNKITASIYFEDVLQVSDFIYGDGVLDVECNVDQSYPRD